MASPLTIFERKYNFHKEFVLWNFSRLFQKQRRETLNNVTIGYSYSVLNNFVFVQSTPYMYSVLRRDHLTTLNIEFKSSCLVSEEPTTPASDKPCGFTWLYPRNPRKRQRYSAAAASPRVLLRTEYSVPEMRVPAKTQLSGPLCAIITTDRKSL